MPPPTASILAHVQEVTEPRIERQKLHQWLAIMGMLKVERRIGRQRAVDSLSRIKIQ